jgi:hypothetical protein
MSDGSPSVGEIVAAHPNFTGEPDDVAVSDVAQFIEQSSSQHRRPQFGDIDTTELASANEVPRGEGSHDKRWVVEIDGAAFDIHRRASPDAANITVHPVRNTHERETILDEMNAAAEGDQ